MRFVRCVTTTTNQASRIALGDAAIVRGKWPWKVKTTVKTATPNIDYEIFKIRSYNTWDLYLHKEQFPYIGRCYAAAKNPDAQNVMDISTWETEELFIDVVPDWFTAVKTLYQADWPNVAFLGNDWRHLHAHLIPRYFESRKFHEIEFVDPKPTKNYAPYEKKELSLELLLKIRDQIREQV